MRMTPPLLRHRTTRACGFGGGGKEREGKGGWGAAHVETCVGRRPWQPAPPFFFRFFPFFFRFFSFFSFRLVQLLHSLASARTARGRRDDTVPLPPSSTVRAVPPPPTVRNAPSPPRTSGGLGHTCVGCLFFLGGGLGPRSKLVWVGFYFALATASAVPPVARAGPGGGPARRAPDRRRPPVAANLLPRTSRRQPHVVNLPPPTHRPRPTALDAAHCTSSTPPPRTFHPLPPACCSPLRPPPATHRPLVRNPFRRTCMQTLPRLRVGPVAPNALSPPPSPPSLPEKRRPSSRHSANLAESPHAHTHHATRVRRRRPPRMRSRRTLRPSRSGDGSAHLAPAPRPRPPGLCPRRRLPPLRQASAPESAAMRQSGAGSASQPAGRARSRWALR